MRWLVTLVLLTACEEAATPGFGIAPGGGNVLVAGVGATDAGIINGDALAIISGRVCFLIANPQTLTACEATGAGGLIVTLDSAVATTDDDGSFVIAVPAVTTNLAWTVTSNDVPPRIVPSLVPFVTTTTTLPAIQIDAYQLMLSSVNASGDQGALMTRVTRVGVPVAGATVTTQPLPDAVFYDGASAVDWRTDATGPNGVAWIPTFVGSSATVIITAGQVSTVFGTVPVQNGAVTYVLATIP